MKFKETINDFLHYIKNPKDEKNEDATIRVKVETLIRLFLFTLPIICGHLLLLLVLEKYNILNAGSNINSMLIYKYSYFELMLIGVVLAPVVEEFIFRLPLRYKNNYLLRFFAYLIGSIGFADKESFNEKVQCFWQKYFKYFFYLIVVAFGCVHFFNFTDYNKLWAWIPVLVFVQLLIGPILGYIRVRFSLPWSMAYHALHNFVFFSIALLSFSSVRDQQYKNKDYSFSFQESNSAAGRADYSVALDKVEFQNYKLAEALEIVFEKPGKYFVGNKLGEMYVNIDFKNKHKQTNTTSNLKLVSENIKKVLKGRMQTQVIEKNVLELYVSDPLKYKKALSELSGKRLVDFKRICRLLDYQYADNYFASDDSKHLIPMDFNRNMPFDELKKNWKEKYGLGFKEEIGRLEFIHLE